MSDAADLLALPPELDGLPEARRREAFANAEAMLPAAAILATLGEAALDAARVQAAAHWLSKSGVATGYDDPKPAHPSQGASGSWAGSPYGDAVAAILARLPRPSGRGRRLPMVVA